MHICKDLQLKNNYCYNLSSCKQIEKQTIYNISEARLIGCQIDGIKTTISFITDYGNVVFDCFGYNDIIKYCDLFSKYKRYELGFKECTKENKWKVYNNEVGNNVFEHGLCYICKIRLRTPIFELGKKIPNFYCERFVNELQMLNEKNNSIQTFTIVIRQVKDD